MAVAEKDRLGHLQAAYDAFYRRHERHDSPEKSRTALVDRMSRWLLDVEVDFPVVLNLGAGAQMLEQQWLSFSRNEKHEKLAERLGAATLVTLDFANIPLHLLRKTPVPHVRADSRALPFADASIDLVVSNHSVDMLRAEPGAFEAAVHGIRRVLKPGGTALFNYHPAPLYDAHVAFYQENPAKRRKRPHNAQYYDGERNPYYADPADIRNDLVASGLVPTAVQQVMTLDSEGWWEVSAVKPAA